MSKLFSLSVCYLIIRKEDNKGEGNKDKKEVEQETVEFPLGSSVICVSDILLIVPPPSWFFVCHVLYSFKV